MPRIFNQRDYYSNLSGYISTNSNIVNNPGWYFLTKNKMKPTFLSSIALLILMGCEIDNYEAPDLTITGQIVDAETKELVESGGINSGTILKFYEGNSQQPLLYQTYPEGTFTNRKVVSGVYTIKADELLTEMKGRKENIAINAKQEITVEVIPNVRLSITLEETSRSTAKAYLTFEKVVHNQELLDLGVVWAE